jgi:triacylglycerol lipase
MLNYYEFPDYVFVIDIIILSINLLIILLNGIHRILYLSKRLKFFLRLVFLFFMWIPPVNIIFVLYFSALAKKEFEYECFVKELESINAESEICKTKYPILMLHGIGFRDYKYTNYWGRIPKRLIKYGATIYYGNQKAWGTIEDNALEIKEKIKEKLK